MNKFRALFAGVFLFSLFTLAQTTSAENIHRDEVFTTLEEAFNQQVEISEKARTIQEIEEKLKPYFTNEMINKFIKENVVKVDNGYATLGSDSAENYIPFFSYNDHTTIEKSKDEDQLVISEDLAEHSEGPITYTNSETVILVKHQGKWKVHQINLDIEKKQENNQVKDEQISSKSTIEKVNTETLGFSILPQSLVISLNRFQLQAFSTIDDILLK